MKLTAAVEIIWWKTHCPIPNFLIIEKLNVKLINQD